MIDRRLVICAVLSVLAHIALARGLEQLPKHKDFAPPQKIEVRVIEPPPPPPPEPPKDPEPKEDPKPVPHEIPKARPTHTVIATLPKEAPPPDHPAVQGNASDDQVFNGGSFGSISSAGPGPAVPSGNTTVAGPGPAPGKGKPDGLPVVAAAEATKLPLPQGRCFGKYTDEAKAAGVEGTVVIDLIVGEDGRARDIEVKSGLPHGLTEAAIAALKECRFSPGERDGKAVPVRVRGFKIRFVLDSNN